MLFNKETIIAQAQHTLPQKSAQDRMMSSEKKINLNMTYGGEEKRASGWDSWRDNKGAVLI